MFKWIKRLTGRKPADDTVTIPAHAPVKVDGIDEAFMRPGEPVGQTGNAKRDGDTLRMSFGWHGDDVPFSARAEKYPLLWVEWWDSCTSPDWAMGDRPLEADPIRVTSVGWKLTETDEAIVLTQSIGHDPEQFGARIVIPQGCIEQTKVLRPAIG